LTTGSSAAFWGPFTRRKATAESPYGVSSDRFSGCTTVESPKSGGGAGGRSSSLLRSRS